MGWGGVLLYCGKGCSFGVGWYFVGLFDCGLGLDIDEMVCVLRVGCVCFVCGVCVCSVCVCDGLFTILKIVELKLCPCW